MISWNYKTILVINKTLVAVNFINQPFFIVYMVGKAKKTAEKAPEKTEVYAINDGKVVLTVNLSNYGKTVIIDHGLDIFSLYLHLEEFKISEG